MNELKYCCDWFRSYTLRENQCHPNIRIVKLVTPGFFEDDGRTKRKFLKNHLRFFLTEGYSGAFSYEGVLKTFIEYCPFCGKDLYRFYKDDAYAQEVENETFRLFKEK